jgi:3-hydroxybutyryl-CoA dehydrogenase
MMNIAIRSTQDQKSELIEKGFTENVNVQWIESNKTIKDVKAHVFFDLTFDDMNIAENEFIDDKPVFVHAVNCTCSEINRPNYIRLNAWAGFMQRPLIELAVNNINIQKIAENIFNEIGWKYVFTNDNYGFIAARIIAAIINEAFFTLENKVSTKEEIDVAMKLGTNYPFGPFEWSEKIGLANIMYLLKQLSKIDDRYTASPLLVHEYQQF